MRLETRGREHLLICWSALDGEVKAKPVRLAHVGVVLLLEVAALLGVAPLGAPPFGVAPLRIVALGVVET